MIVFNIVILVIQQHDKQRIDVAFPVPEPRGPGPGEIVVTCKRCGWSNYYAPDRARRGLAGHMNWCRRED